MLFRSAAAAGGHDQLVRMLDAVVAAYDRRRPSLVEKLRLKQRLRVARHRWRFWRDTGRL